ncbi:MAG: CYTH and CHAD domain-containing protein [Nitrospira sp.]|nr:CYTH and CHAD domain-containing protein [Nitrospira sp.]
MARSREVSSQRPSVLSAHTERELKLSIGDDFHLPRLPGTLRPRRLLISTYYDTAAYDLAHARMTLRQRIERGKKTWQLKLPLGEDRQEVEVPDERADPPASLRRLLVLHLRHRKLAPVVTLRVWRTGLQIRHGQVPLAEIALDRVSVVQHGTTMQRFRELEIELQQGDDALLHTLEQQMRDAGASDHDGRPKFFRALSLHPPPPVPPPDRTASVGAHIQWALAQHVEWLLAHDPGTRLGTDLESLHQMRVAVRRVRAVLRTARPVLLPAWGASLDQELEWLGKVLGPARDLDVQLAYFREESTTLDARDRARLEPLISHLQAHRNAAQQVVLNALTSTRYLALIRRLQQAAQAPAVIESPLTVRQLARHAFKKLRKALRRLRPSPSDAALHAIRIKTKRARYAAELAKRSGGQPATRFITAARALQELLGTHQDAIQAERQLRQFLQDSPSPRAGFVAGRMVERQHHRRQTVRETMAPLVKTLLKRGKQVWGSTGSRHRHTY